MNTPLAIFTPSLVDPDTLERLFVAREPVLADLVARASKAMVGQTRAHRLLVGPRGAGKTHLMALAHHRISNLEPVPTLAWLPEDPWMIDGYADLLREILGTASKEGKSTSAERRRMPADALEDALRSLAARDGPIVVLGENFDRILATIDTAGQRRLRRFMENDRALLLLVTATRLTAELLRQDGPFYGFFSTVELAPLTVEEATDMLARIAGYRGDEALATRLRAPGGPDRYRLAAIDAIAGGQPRVWALLASALTVDGLDSLAEVLLTRFDDLTPYYQEQLGRLAPRERKVVRTLADLDRALNVKELAEELGVDQKSMSKTVSTLREQGWLAEVQIPLGVGDARKTYFELAEPLARIAFQLKDNRGEAIPLLVTFLSTWFSREQLDTPLERLSEFVRRHLETAIGHAGGLHEVAEAFGQYSNRKSFGISSLSTSWRTKVDLTNALLHALADALVALSRRDPTAYLELSSTERHVLRSAIEEHGVEGAQRLCIGLGPGDQAWTAKAERLAETGSESIANRRLVAELYRLDGRNDAAVMLLDELILESTDTFGAGDALTLDLRLARLDANKRPVRGQTYLEALNKLLTECIYALGENHGLTLRVRVSLMLSTAPVDYSAASNLQDALLSSLSKSDRHLDRKLVEMAFRVTLISRTHGETQGAPISRLLEESLPDAIDALGRDHYLVLWLREIIAGRAAEEGDKKLALRLLHELSQDQTRLLGSEHPNTLLTSRRIANLTAPRLTSPMASDTDADLGFPDPQRTISTRNPPKPRHG